MGAVYLGMVLGSPFEPDRSRERLQSGSSSGRPQSVVTSADSGLNLVLVTLDGVRLQEFLGGGDPVEAGGPVPELFPYFWHTLAPTGTVYGDQRRFEYMTVANPTMVSLPAYESIFVGRPQPCQGNDCPRVTRETVLERLVHELGLGRGQVATIASWEGLLFALESRPGTTMVNAGIQELHSDGTLEERLINEAQAKDLPPWDDARFDRYTWQHARRYLSRYRPRLLYLAFLDADGWGHQVRYDKYLDALRNYDAWLHDLVADLRSMGSYGEHTCLIVTSDHGRGHGRHWYTHSNGEPESAYVLMYAGCPLRDAPRFHRPTTWTTHLAIRPSIEALFGLTPANCLWCAPPLVNQTPPVAAIAGGSPRT